MKKPRGSKREGAVYQTRGGAPPAPSPAASGEPPPLRSGARLRGPGAAPEEAPCKDFMDAYLQYKGYVRAGFWKPGLENDVPDLCQKVWLRIHRRIDAGDMPHPMKATLAGIIADETLLHYRTVGRQRIAGEPDDDAAPPSKPDPELLYAREEDAAFRRELLAATAAELPPHEQQALNLVDFDENAPEEAARMIGCPYGTLAARLHRARKNFVKAGQRMALLLQRQRRKG